MSATADGTWPHWRTLIEEDGPMCAICFEDVVPGAAEWDLRPTVDHIVALFSGGKHIRSNAQLAHHRCNSDKAQF
jgi:5-methylcytosine-specific restriction endonuclease McrA